MAAALRGALDALIREAVQAAMEARELGRAFQHRVAGRNPIVDGRYAGLPSFPKVVTELGQLPRIRALCDPANQECLRKIALQLVYAALANFPYLPFHRRMVDGLFKSFLQELDQAEWRCVGVANLQNFQSTCSRLDFGDGITIRHRDLKALRKAFSWRQSDAERLARDWQEVPAGSHVLQVEYPVRKAPDTLVSLDSAGPREMAQTMLLALRLFKPGEVRIGRMFVSRPSVLRHTDGAESLVGLPAWRPGPRYALDLFSEVDAVKDLRRKLLALRAIDNRGARRLNLALRSFSAIYDRYPHTGEDRILDAFTAAEAIAGTSTEMPFRLAFRIAALLAKTDDERVVLFERMVDYQRIRSAIMHGDELGRKALALVEDDEPLRAIVRRLLVAFLNLTQSPQVTLDKRFFNELDQTLQHGERRSALQREMDL